VDRISKHNGAQKPAKQKIVPQLLAKLPIAPDRVKPDQQQRFQNLLRRHRGSPKLAIHPVKHPRQFDKLLISHLFNPSQRMITGNSCIDRTGLLTAPAPFGFHSTSSNDFRFCILRPGLEPALSISKGQVSDFQLSETKFKNRLAHCCASVFYPNPESAIGNLKFTL
jgi:hypothetical protein